MGEIRVLLADDHEIFRNGLVQLIDKESDLKVVGQASCGSEVLDLVREVSADVVILDIRMPEMNGLEVAKVLMKRGGRARIIIFSLYDNKDYVTQSLSLGVSGFLLKDTSNKIFLEAIRSVHKGLLYYIGDVSDVVIKYFREQESVTTVVNKMSAIVDSSIKVSLSKRETEILGFIAKGLNSKQTADELGLSVRTVDAHRLNVLRKHGVKSMDEVLELRSKY